MAQKAASQSAVRRILLFSHPRPRRRLRVSESHSALLASKTTRIQLPSFSWPFGTKEASNKCKFSAKVTICAAPNHQTPGTSSHEPATIRFGFVGLGQLELLIVFCRMDGWRLERSMNLGELNFSSTFSSSHTITVLSRSQLSKVYIFQELSSISLPICTFLLKLQSNDWSSCHQTLGL